MLFAIAARIVAFLLILEAMFAGLRLAGLLSQLGIYDAPTIALILARGLLGALQFTGGWLLATSRPQGPVIAQWALIGGALLTPLDVGLNLAPTEVYPWWRWQTTAVYLVYAIGGYLVLASRRRK